MMKLSSELKTETEVQTLKFGIKLEIYSTKIRKLKGNFEVQIKHVGP